MMRALLVAVLSLGLLAAPAEAAQVLLKDGRVLSGTLKVEGAGLVVTGADGKPQTLSYAQVQAISLDDQPVGLAPSAEPTKLLDNDWLVWTAVGANVATMVVGLVVLYRAATAK